MTTVKKFVSLTIALLWLAGAPSAYAQSAISTPPPAAPATTAEKKIEINRAARVALVDGDVTAYSATKQKRTLAVGDYVSEGDSIVTGNDGELHLDMEDGGYMSVRPNTKMRFVKYQAKGENTDSAVFSLLEGSFRSVTGWIGKFNSNNYTVRAPNATVGIRGTDHEPFVIPKGSNIGEAGTYDKVNEGGSFILTPSGRADVAPNQSGFVTYDKGAKPRILKEIPKHFRAGRFEQRFIGKHAEVLARIEKRREDRRSEIKQKLEAAKVAAQAERAQKQNVQQAQKEKREAAQAKREEAKKAREAAKEKAKKEIEDKHKAALEAADAENPEHADKAEKAARKLHPLRK